MNEDEPTIEPVAHRHPEIMSGIPVFVGTRVPVRTLLDHLVDSDGMDEFLENFPGVTRKQATQFLKAGCRGVGRSAVVVRVNYFLG